LLVIFGALLGGPHPPLVFASPLAVTQIVAAPAPGIAWDWGYNGRGTLGAPSTDQCRERLTHYPVGCSTTPIQIGGLTNVIALDGGGGHSLALEQDGTVWAWGGNTEGELGDGTTTDRSAPVKVLGLSDVAAISAGLSHSLALNRDGTVWTWGLG